MYLPCERTESLNILLGLYRIYIEVFVMGYLSIDDRFPPPMEYLLSNLAVDYWI